MDSNASMTDSHSSGYSNSYLTVYNSLSEITIESLRLERRRWFNDDESNTSRQILSNLKRPRMTAGVSWTAKSERETENRCCCKRTVRQRFGPCERAGTFELVTTDRGLKATCLIEFVVWRKTKTGRRVLWFTGKNVMPVAAVDAVRALEVWTDRTDGYPCKVVFLKK